MLMPPALAGVTADQFGGPPLQRRPPACVPDCWSLAYDCCRTAQYGCLAHILALCAFTACHQTLMARCSQVWLHVISACASCFCHPLLACSSHLAHKPCVAAAASRVRVASASPQGSRASVDARHSSRPALAQAPAAIIKGLVPIVAHKVGLAQARVEYTFSGQVVAGLQQHRIVCCYLHGVLFMYALYTLPLFVGPE